MPSRKAGGAAKPPPKDDAEQSRRFEETARELDADHGSEAFERALNATLPNLPNARKKATRQKKA